MKTQNTGDLFAGFGKWLESEEGQACQREEPWPLVGEDTQQAIRLLAAYKAGTRQTATHKADELAAAAESMLTAMWNTQHSDGCYTLGETGHFQTLSRRLEEYKASQ